MTAKSASEVVEAEGHLIDSQLLNGMFDTVVRHDAAFEVLEFRIGRTNDEPSFVSMRVTAPAEGVLSELLAELVGLGCRVARAEDARTMAADRDGCAPEDFYSTTNHQTFIRREGQWVPVQQQRMDAAIVIDEGGGATCRKLREIRFGDAVVCGIHGIKIVPEFQARDRLGFAFMSNEISSERRVEVGVSRIAAMMRDTKQAGDRIAVVAGPVVVHTGGGSYFCELIRRGYVDVLLAGNALAVHDVEQALFGTSLGVDLETGRPIEGGHRHHMRAINTIFRAGGLRQAVDQGVLTSGVMHECIRRNVDYVLGRQHPRRWAAARHRRQPRGSPGSLHGGAAGREARARAVDDAARHRRREHAAGGSAPRVRGYQSGGRHQARRPRLFADDRHRHRRGPVSAPACVSGRARLTPRKTNWIV
jgi:lysine-ketoglutarate reductase/saccharopine dehydrogenase-like protein (TIGR00300 family)